MMTRINHMLPDFKPGDGFDENDIMVDTTVACWKPCTPARLVERLHYLWMNQTSNDLRPVTHYQEAEAGGFFVIHGEWSADGFLPDCMVYHRDEEDKSFHVCFEYTA